MELLIFGDRGKPILFFPTRTARFYDYEDWGVIASLKEQITSGKIQVYCVDSADTESFYCKTIAPSDRIQKHLLFEKYILNEVIPLIKYKNKNPYIISAGCSLGAYHAVNIAFRYPHLFKKVIGMSGRYDLTLKLQYFDDLFEGFWDEHIYFNMPTQYIQNFTNRQTIRALQKLEIILVIGLEDAFLQNNIELSEQLSKKSISNTLYFWEGEAHKARFWSEMLKMYLL